MKVKKLGNLIVFESLKAKTIFPLVGSKYKPDDGHDIVLNNDNVLNVSKNSLFINTPGEFESKDVFVYDYSKENCKDNLFSIDIEGVNVIIFNSSSPIKDLFSHSELLENDVLICNVDAGFVDVSAAVDELEPSIFMLTGTDDSKIDEAVKKLSLNVNDTQSSYNFTDSDFDSEIELPMRVVILK